MKKEIPDKTINDIKKEIEETKGGEYEAEGQP